MLETQIEDIRSNFIGNNYPKGIQAAIEVMLEEYDDQETLSPPAVVALIGVLQGYTHQAFPVRDPEQPSDAEGRPFIAFRYLPLLTQALLIRATADEAKILPRKKSTN